MAVGLRRMAGGFVRFDVASRRVRLCWNHSRRPAAALMCTYRFHACKSMACISSRSCLTLIFSKLMFLSSFRGSCKQKHTPTVSKR